MYLAASWEKKPPWHCVQTVLMIHDFTQTLCKVFRLGFFDATRGRLLQ